MTHETDDADPFETPPPAPKHRVGYGSPPLHSRFKPGQSGNAKGRPKGARGYRKLFREALEQKITVQDRDGRTRRKRAIDIIIQREVAKAIKGEDKALTRVQNQARALDLEDEIKLAGRDGARLTEREEEILAHYAPNFLSPMPEAGGSPLPTLKKEENDNEDQT
jgi:hypothetical protein